MAHTILDNDKPVDFRSPAYAPLFERLQGNILKGHGRDFTLNIFLEFHRTGTSLREILAALARRHVTSARDQLLAIESYKRTGAPGPVFGNLFLTRNAYEKLGYGDALESWFPDPAHDAGFPRSSRFRTGMLAAARDLGDSLTQDSATEPLETAYLRGNIDAMLLLADDSEANLSREAKPLLQSLEQEGLASVLAVEAGRLRRNADRTPIEHFGFVDGRSQPLFLASDFIDLAADGSIDVTRTTEKLPGGVRGRLENWNPFARLSIALLKDPGVSDPLAHGSYFVFRKLEQNVRAFFSAEERLADELGLTGDDRARAGAMLIGRFRDGTPLVRSGGPASNPAQSNDFRFDGLNALLVPDASAPRDRLGLRCPFQAHIRKMSPRQSIVALSDGDADITTNEREALARRLVRRGITYGDYPSGASELSALPTEGVGILFACFQSSIMQQFAFVQHRWANSIRFRVDGGAGTPTGVDPVMGQRLSPDTPPHNWRYEYGGSVAGADPHHLDDIQLGESHPVKAEMRNFVKFRGGEFFFAPSLPFLFGS